QAEQILYLKRTLAERIAMHTGQTLEQIEIDSDRDRWFTADEAKDYGFVDRGIRSATEVPTVGAGSGPGDRQRRRRQSAAQAASGAGRPARGTAGGPRA